VVEKSTDAVSWATVKTVVTGGDGGASFTDSSDEAGLVFYRATSGTLSGETVVSIFDVEEMPAAVGPNLAVATKGCGGGITGSAGNVSLIERTTTTAPACTVMEGDYVEASWTLTGNCTTVRIGNISVSGNDSDENPLARVDLSIDGQPFRDDEPALGPGESTGPTTVNGDPMQSVVLRMTVVNGNGSNLTAALSGVQAVCS
jgi:hypothetical protein